MIQEYLSLVTPLDPLRNDGYQFWSGIGSGSPIFGAVVLWWHHNKCIEKRCFRKGHKDPVHGHPLCRKHQNKLDK